MLYKLLGILVWNGAKVLLRQKYGPTYLPKSVLAGGAVVAAVGVGLLVRARSDS